MRRGVMALGFAAGCFNPTVPAGAPCATDVGCPEPQTCIARVCSYGPPPVDAATEGEGDGDGDGFSDVRDNCPAVRNVDQVDEDRDLIGDVCDPCPVLPVDAADLDGDADGIPDRNGCDPGPTTQDSIWQFYGFTSVPAGEQTGGWDVVEGSYRGAGAGQEFDLVYFVPDLVRAGRTFDDFTVSARVAIDAAIGEHGVGISIADADADGAEIDCELFFDGSTRGLRLVLPSPSVITPFAWTDRVDYRLALRHSGGTYSCTATGPDDVVHSANGNASNRPRDGNAASIYAFDVTAQFRWLFVVGSP